MVNTISSVVAAERAYAQVASARRRAAVARAVRAVPRDRGRLPVHAVAPAGGPAAPVVPRGVHPLPLTLIDGTVQPSRASQFDGAFRPLRAVRARWQRIWAAELRGEPLPPISVVPVGERYAVRDGHLRVSVARARGAVAIDAVVEAP